MFSSKQGDFDQVSSARYESICSDVETVCDLFFCRYLGLYSIRAEMPLDTIPPLLDQINDAGFHTHQRSNQPDCDIAVSYLEELNLMLLSY